jgi:hypothetical protein
MLARTGGPPLPELGAGPESIQAELKRVPPAQPATASGQDQRLTKNDSDKGAAIIPIDAQIARNKKASEEPPGGTTERTSRPSSIGRTCSGLREPPRPWDESRTVERDTKNLRPRQLQK